MNTSTSHFFNPAILLQPISSAAPLRAPAATAPKSKVNQAARMPAALWRHTVDECEGAHRHGFAVRSLCALLGAASIGSMAAAAWQMHALLSGNHLHDMVSAFLP